MSEKSDQMYHPPEEIRARAHVASLEEYKRLYKQSLDDPEAFWSKIAEDFFWKQRWHSPFSRRVSLNGTEVFRRTVGDILSVIRRQNFADISDAATFRLTLQLSKTLYAREEPEMKPLPNSVANAGGSFTTDATSIATIILQQMRILV